MRLVKLIPTDLLITGYLGICAGCNSEVRARPCAAMIAKTGKRHMLCAACYRDLMRLHRFARAGLLVIEVGE